MAVNDMPIADTPSIIDRNILPKPAVATVLPVRNVVAVKWDTEAMPPPAIIAKLHLNNGSMS